MGGAKKLTENNITCVFIITCGPAGPPEACWEAWENITFDSFGLVSSNNSYYDWPPLRKKKTKKQKRLRYMLAVYTESAAVPTHSLNAANMIIIHSRNFIMSVFSRGYCKDSWLNLCATAHLANVHVTKMASFSQSSIFYSNTKTKLF